MANTQSLIAQAYAAFNARNIDAALALMTDDVAWPKASEGGSVIGKAEIRAYWTRQWQDFDPHVDPIAITEREDGKTEVKVHQLVKSLTGDILFDGDVVHLYTITNNLIARMDLQQADPTSPQTPSAAFAKH